MSADVKRRLTDYRLRLNITRELSRFKTPLTLQSPQSLPGKSVDLQFPARYIQVSG
jgi:hypothetical protein